MAFELPVKDLIVNEDTQVALLNASGAAYAATNATPSSGGVIMPGFLELSLGSEFDLLTTATRIIKTVTAAAVAQTSTFVVTSVTALADATFKIVYQSLDLTPSEFQQVAPEKRYQIPVQSATDGIGVAIVNAVTADKYSPVTVTYNAGTDTLTFVAKNPGITFTFYSDTITGTQTVTVAASNGSGIYSTIKNAWWTKNAEVDRNLNYFPRIGASYTEYYFRLSRLAADGGGEGEFPSEKKQLITSAFRLFVRNGLTFETKMNLLVTDLNV